MVCPLVLIVQVREDLQDVVGLRDSVVITVFIETNTVQGIEATTARFQVLDGTMELRQAMYEVERELVIGDFFVVHMGVQEAVGCRAIIWVDELGHTGHEGQLNALWSYELVEELA